MTDQQSEMVGAVDDAFEGVVSDYGVRRLGPRWAVLPRPLMGPEQATEIETFDEELQARMRLRCMALDAAIEAARPFIERAMLREMMEPNEAMLSEGMLAWVENQDKPGDVENAAIWKAMLQAFAKSHNTDLAPPIPKETKHDRAK